MSEEEFFRRLLLGIFALVVPFALFFRLRSYTGEQLDRWQEGALILIGLRLSALPWFLGCGLWIVHPPWMNWSSVHVPTVARWFGLVLVLLWSCLLLWTFFSLGKNLTDTVVIRKEHTLITTGPYRFVRHPFYLAFFFAVLGGSLVTANWFLLLSALLPTVFLILRTKIEEEKLVERFGDAYRKYIKKTGRFFPRLF